MITSWKCVGHVLPHCCAKWEWEAEGSEGLVNTAEGNCVLREVVATVKLVTLCRTDQVDNARFDAVHNVCNKRHFVVL